MNKVSAHVRGLYSFILRQGMRRPQKRIEIEKVLSHVFCAFTSNQKLNRRRGTVNKKPNDMKKLLFIAIISALALSFSSCDKIPNSLAGTSWSCYVDGDLDTMTFISENIMKDAYGESYTYTYDKPYVHINTSNGIVTGKIGGNELEITNPYGEVYIYIRD